MTNKIIMPDVGIMTRIDGWLIADGRDPTEIPPSVAAEIRRNLPALREGNSVSDILGRMLARQRAHDLEQRALLSGEFDDDD